MEGCAADPSFQLVCGSLLGSGRRAAAEEARLALILEGFEFSLPLIRHAAAVAGASRCCRPGPPADRASVGRRNPAKIFLP